MKSSVLCLLLATFILSLTSQAEEVFPKAKFASYVTASVIRLKSTKVEGGDYDDKTEKLSFKIVLRNSSPTVAFGNIQMKFFLFGQSMVNTKAFKLMQAETKDFSLEPLKTLEIETPEVVSMWDNTDAVFGEKYKGWFLRILAPDGTILLEKSTSSFFSNTNTLESTQVGMYYDKALQPLSVAHQR